MFENKAKLRQDGAEAGAELGKSAEQAGAELGQSCAKRMLSWVS